MRDSGLNLELNAAPGVRREKARVSNPELTLVLGERRSEMGAGTQPRAHPSFKKDKKVQRWGP